MALPVAALAVAVVGCAAPPQVSETRSAGISGRTLVEDGAFPSVVPAISVENEAGVRSWFASGPVALPHAAVVVRQGGARGSIAAAVESDGQGRFRLTLPTGLYTAHMRFGRPDHGPSEEVTVIAGAFSSVLRVSFAI